MTRSRAFRSRRALAAAALAVCLAAVVGWIARPGEPAESPYALVVRDSAAAAAREADLDLDRVLREAADAVFARLPHRGRIRIDVRVASDQRGLIPELGLGGFTDGSGQVFLWTEQRLRDDAERWLPAVLAHELHHSSRFRLGPPRVGTLGEALVAEGLADHFVAEVFPAAPRLPWDLALTPGEESSLWGRAEAELDAVGGYDHTAWFFGEGSLPRWAGYALGYRVVQAHLDEGHTAAGSVRAEPAAVIAAYAARQG